MGCSSVVQQGSWLTSILTPGTGEGNILRRRRSTEAAEAAEREEYERQQSLIASQQTAIMRAAASGATAPSGIPATTRGLLQQQLKPA